MNLRQYGTFSGPLQPRVSDTSIGRACDNAAKIFGRQLQGSSVERLLGDICGRNIFTEALEREFVLFRGEYKKLFLQVQGVVVNGWFYGAVFDLGYACHTSADSMLDSILTACEHLDGHIERVGDYTGTLALLAGCDFDEAMKMKGAAMKHDIGKIFVPQHILHHPGMLSEYMWNEIKLHPITGAKLLEALGETKQKEKGLARNGAQYHHEYFSGRGGYPGVRMGDEIPFMSRLVAVADVLDALVSERPYKKPMAVDRAVTTMLYNPRHEGQFDPKLLALLKDNQERFRLN
jgi:HD-GYP domain-containing protein (c-di-GMP phosphodiesterase class II)